MKKLLCVSMIAVVLTTGCVTTNNSVGDYAIGDDSAMIKSGRNRESAQISRAELEQHRRQRTNVSEELDLESKKRGNRRREIDGNLGTAAQATGLVGGIMNIFR
jgi:hypothetical protein